MALRCAKDQALQACKEVVSQGHRGARYNQIHQTSAVGVYGPTRAPIDKVERVCRQNERVESPNKRLSAIFLWTIKRWIDWQVRQRLHKKIVREWGPDRQTHGQYFQVAQGEIAKRLSRYKASDDIESWLQPQTIPSSRWFAGVWRLTIGIWATSALVLAIARSVGHAQPSTWLENRWDQWVKHWVGVGEYLTKAIAESS